MKKIKIKKSLIATTVALSSVAIAVPTLLTSCGSLPKYTLSWDTQITSNITPYTPSNYKEYHFMDQSTALNLWMDNLSDKQKTLDVLSVPFVALSHYLHAFYETDNQQSPVEIEIYKSHFEWAKETHFLNFKTGDFQANDIILWSFSIKIKVFPAFPLSLLNAIMNSASRSSNSVDFFPDWNVDSISLSVDNFPIAISCLNLMDGFLRDEDKNQYGLGIYSHLNCFLSFDWLWDDPEDFIGPTGITSLTDAVNTKNSHVEAHVLAPFNKTVKLDIPDGYLFSLISDFQWGKQPMGLVSYYLSELSLAPPKSI